MFSFWCENERYLSQRRVRTRRRVTAPQRYQLVPLSVTAGELLHRKGLCGQCEARPFGKKCLTKSRVSLLWRIIVFRGASVIDQQLSRFLSAMFMSSSLCSFFPSLLLNRLGDLVLKQLLDPCGDTSYRFAVELNAATLQCCHRR